MDRHVPSEPDAAPGLRERKRLQTLDLLTRSAYTLFETHGYDGVTMEQIAAQAGVSKGTLQPLSREGSAAGALLPPGLARSARDLLPLMKLPGFAQRLTKTLHASAHWSEAHRAWHPALSAGDRAARRPGRRPVSAQAAYAYAVRRADRIWPGRRRAAHRPVRRAARPTPAIAVPGRADPLAGRSPRQPEARVRRRRQPVHARRREPA